jgi:tripartite-type tricarboxylate transporter receptor subunit TctC
MVRLALVALGLAQVPYAVAQSFPSRSIKLIVPFPGGANVDRLARSYAAHASQVLNVPVVVANIPGVAGARGIVAGAKEAPDGYTLIMVRSSTLSSLPAIDAFQKSGGQHPASDLIPIAMLSANPLLLAVSADSKWPDLKSFIADTGSQPGGTLLGVPGEAGSGHFQLLADLLKRATGRTELTKVPYRSDKDALQALAEKRVAAILGEPGALMESIKSGKVRPLAVSGAARLSILPDVPTFKESGYQQLELYIWTGLFAPPGTPSSVIDVLRKTTEQAFHGSNLAGDINQLGLIASYKDAKALGAIRDTDLMRIRDLQLSIPARDQFQLICDTTRASYNNRKCEANCDTTCSDLGRRLSSCGKPEPSCLPR